MKEEFKKDNDYTLSVVSTEKDSITTEYNSIETIRSITRTFNFAAEQLTTLVEKDIYQSQGFKKGGSSGTSVSMIKENFCDLPSSKEVEYIHTKLKELGGNPPAFDDIDFTPATKRGVTIKKQPQRLG